MKKFLVISLLVTCLTMPEFCMAAEGGPEPPPAGEAVLEGQGTLSKTSEAGANSIFASDNTDDYEDLGTDEKLQGMLDELTTTLPSGNGSWSVYIYDTVNVSEGSLNSHPMQAASLIKLYIMGAVYENYDNLTAQYGKDNVDSNLRYMITVSDNDAANTLVTYLGGGDSTTGRQVVNTYCSNHGYNDTTMGRMLLQGTENGDNITSVTDCGHFLMNIYDEKDSEEDSHAADMFRLLAAQERRNKIPAQMSEGVRVANKTGELSDVENDAGILYDSGNDLVIVFMSEYLSEVGSAQNTIASLSRRIYDYYNQ